MPICHFCNLAEKCRLNGTNPTEVECEREQSIMEEEDDIHHEIVPDEGLADSVGSEFIFDDEEDDEDLPPYFETNDYEDNQTDEDEVDTSDPWYVPDDEED